MSELNEKRKIIKITLTGDLVDAWEVVLASAPYKDNSDCFRDILRGYMEYKSLKVSHNVADD
jgi:metal-responsive CopG/Arc/MetJ family transcriptional regulator